MLQKPGELLENIYARYYLLLNELRKNKFQKQNLEIYIKFLNYLLPEWKPYASNVMQNRNLTSIDIHDVFELLNQNQDEVSDLIGIKDQKEKVDPIALLAKKSIRLRSTRAEKEVKPLSESENEVSDPDKE